MNKRPMNWPNIGCNRLCAGSSESQTATSFILSDSLTEEDSRVLEFVLLTNRNSSWAWVCNIDKLAFYIRVSFGPDYTDDPESETKPC
jgi:hypothetical protein